MHLHTTVYFGAEVSHRRHCLICLMYPNYVYFHIKHCITWFSTLNMTEIGLELNQVVVLLVKVAILLEAIMLLVNCYWLLLAITFENLITNDMLVDIIYCKFT